MKRSAFQKYVIAPTRKKQRQKMSLCFETCVLGDAIPRNTSKYESARASVRIDTAAFACCLSTICGINHSIRIGNALYRSMENASLSEMTVISMRLVDSDSETLSPVAFSNHHVQVDAHN